MLRQFHLDLYLRLHLVFSNSRWQLRLHLQESRAFGGFQRTKPPKACNDYHVIPLANSRKQHVALITNLALIKRPVNIYRSMPAADAVLWHSSRTWLSLYAQSILRIHRVFSLLLPWQGDTPNTKGEIEFKKHLTVWAFKKQAKMNSKAVQIYLLSMYFLRIDCVL